MKTIGLIGGMSWESTATYYKIINDTVKDQLGGLNSAKIILYSVNFEEIEKCQASGDWNKSAKILSDVAVKLENAGADFIVICTNTMHKIANEIQQKVAVPILHIAQVTANKIIDSGINKVILLGTKYTMTEDFYKSKLLQAKIEVLIPNESDIETVNDIIYTQLCVGDIRNESRQKYVEIINKLKKDGAEGVILGCTEVGLLIGENDTDLKVFDTAVLHAKQAALNALK